MKGPTGNTTQKRLRILRDDEIDALYGRPRFTAEEREEYFALSSAESAALEQFHAIRSRIYTVLQLGYFKARQLFFVSTPTRSPKTPSAFRNATFPATRARIWRSPRSPGSDLVRQHLTPAQSTALQQLPEDSQGGTGSPP
jgi:hypothetical protein